MLSNLSLLFTSLWWQQTSGALLRTLAAGLAPFLLAYGTGQEVTWQVTASQVGLLLVMTALSSLKGIPTPGTASYWEILGARFLRQFAQFSLAGIGTATLFSDVSWLAVLIGSVASALSTVLIGSLVLLPGQPQETVPDVPPEIEENDPAVVFTEDEPTEQEEALAQADEIADSVADGERYVDA